MTDLAADRPPDAPDRDDAPVLLRLDGVAAGYGPDLALEDVTFAARAGHRVAVLGPNGGGKTTLFRVILGELAARRGTVSSADRVAVVPQTDRSRLDFPITALEVVLMGTIAGRPWWRGPGRRDRAAARDALSAVGLADRADRPFGALSGGQRQRVLVARALVRDARVLLLDEPYRGLDTASAERLDHLIVELADAGRTLLIATHDIGQGSVWDEVLCLNRRQVAFGRPGETLTPDVLHATYGSGLLRLPGEHGGLAVVADHHGDDQR
ncbi:metal ABC transporter ATP-binding protein [Patulibacter sp. S7RM1-6]